MIVVRFSKDQSTPQKGRKLKTAQFEGYVETRPESINNEVYEIDVKTPYLSCESAFSLEKSLVNTNGGPFYLLNNGQNLGLFRVRPFTWAVDSKPIAPKWEESEALYSGKNGGFVKSFRFKVEKAYGVEA